MAAETVKIHVDHLTKRYPGQDKPAVDDISFDVRAGEVLGFVGPNGAGKTTTMKILTSFLAPTGGRAEVAGFDVYEQSLEARRRIGYLPEDTPLYKDMSVLEYLDWVARVRGLGFHDGRVRIKKVAELCAIGHRLGSLIGELSKGYRQRVGLAQAILHEPDVLILDEPTSGLDPNQIVEIRHVIKEYGKDHTVIFSTHILPEVQATCSRVLVIANGKIVADAAPSELGSMAARSSGVRIVVDFGGKAEAMRPVLERIPGVVTVAPFTDGDGPGQLLVSGTEATGLDLRVEIFRAAASHDAPLLEMKRYTPLEGVFRQLTETSPSQPAPSPAHGA